MSRKKIILSCAVTGAIHTPSMSPYLPCGVEGIVGAAVGAAQAGASMVHIHARKEDGEPTGDLDTMGAIISGIKAQSNVVIGITTGGAIGMAAEERYSSIPRFKPEIASLNAGSINFVLSELRSFIDEPQHDWELPFLEGTYGKVFTNSFADMEYAIKMMNDCGTKQEFEVFDFGQLNNIAYFVKKGIVPEPIFLQFVLGIQGGPALNIENLVHITDQAKKLFGKDVQYSIVAGGRRGIRLETFNAINGGHCRVGMEDSIYIKPNGELAKSNAQQVEKITDVLHLLDFEIATPDEAREILLLKGADKVAF